MNDTTSLYRHYDEAGELLYVGISIDAIARFKQHADSRKDWVNSIASVKIQKFETRAEALAAEKLAILTENPKYNIVHNRYGPKTNGPPRKSRKKRVTGPGGLFEVPKAYKFLTGDIERVYRSSFANEKPGTAKVTEYGVGEIIEIEGTGIEYKINAILYDKFVIAQGISYGWETHFIVLPAY